MGWGCREREREKECQIEKENISMWRSFQCKGNDESLNDVCELRYLTRKYHK